MLGATPVPFETPADLVIRRVAERMGVAETYHQPEVGVFFGEPGEEAADPYFHGAGPAVRGCIGCGGCMVGCRYEAKNTLDRNYLWLAERLGTEIHSECEATVLRPLPAGGWEVETVRPGWAGRRTRRTLRADQVVLAAGVLGTLRLLFRSGLGGPHVGELVRTNSEVIVGAGSLSTEVDHSRGVAITSSFHPDADTHIEPVRYSAGSNLMGLLGTVLVDGGGRVPRPLRFLAAAARRPAVFLRTCSVRRWSERTIILLVMQAHDNALRLRWNGRKLRSGSAERPAPTYIPAANEAARLAAEEIGGHPGSSLNEVLLNRPTTAHILGGATIGATADDGVVDAYQRVFAHPGLHVVDGAAVTANLGVNPSLTITAQAERALAFWPNRGEPDRRPPLGVGYERVVPTPPRFPYAGVDRPAPPRGAEEAAAAR
ncbi:MAG: cholesterol oxidase, partial [Gaiellaceae bacterium]|nr:cholesterol oxidase [Gaiellaceae bacterium]